MRSTFLLVGALLTSLAGAAFVADATVQKSAEASAADAVAMAKRQFNIALDGSDNSIDDVERALASVHSAYALASPKPADDQLQPLAKAFGAYLGEVYRKNHGATWGTVTLNGTDYPGFRTAAGVNVWPVGRVMNRITDGPDNNVADFYRKLVAAPGKD
jgi:hypothetical protein